MSKNTSDRNGRALEYSVAISLARLKGFSLTKQSLMLNERDKDKFHSLPSSLQIRYEEASSAISQWVSTLFFGDGNVTIERLNDTPDDPSDFVLISNQSKKYISLKHNHEALKHPRPYSFAQACGYAKKSAEDISHRASMSEVSDHFRDSASGMLLFKDCSQLLRERLYADVCKCCGDSIQRWAATDRDLAKNLFGFLVSNGFYKVIVDTKNVVKVRVQDYLAIPAPHSLTTEVKGNRLVLAFDNDWVLNLRIHTAQSRISSRPSQLSLKFDAQKEMGEVEEFTM